MAAETGSLTSFLIYLAALGLRCCTGFSLVAASQGYSEFAVCGLLIAVAPLISEHRLQGTRASAAEARGLSNCNFRA